MTWHGLRIKTESEVYVVGRPSFDIVAARRFLHHNNLSGHMLSDATGTDAEVLIEMSTRLCYLSFDKGRSSPAFHKHLLELHHGSTIEHANWTLWIAGVSRSWSHEMVRHRAGFGFSQLSQRYVDSSQTAFVMPPSVQQLGALAQDAWISHMLASLDAYRSAVTEIETKLRAEGIDNKTTLRKLSREAARSLLPNAVETMIAVTANARAWRHFIEMRSDVYAEAEMRRVAFAVYQVLLQEAPYLFGDYEEEVLDGGPALRTPNQKV